MEARILATENEISRLRQDLKLSQKALDEGTAVFEAIYVKHQRDVFISLEIFPTFMEIIRIFFFF